MQVQAAGARGCGVREMTTRWRARCGPRWCNRQAEESRSVRDPSSGRRSQPRLTLRTPEAWADPRSTDAPALDRCAHLTYVSPRLPSSTAYRAGGHIKMREEAAAAVGAGGATAAAERAALTDGESEAQQEGPPVKRSETKSRTAHARVHVAAYDWWIVRKQ